MHRWLHFPRPYSYYIRHGYGVYGIRNMREAKALYKFCLNQLAEGNIGEARSKVYHNTLALYKNAFETDPKELSASILRCGCGRCSGTFVPNGFQAYANEHLGYYWS